MLSDYYLQSHIADRARRDGKSGKYLLKFLNSKEEVNKIYETFLLLSFQL